MASWSQAAMKLDPQVLLLTFGKHGQLTEKEERVVVAAREAFIDYGVRRTSMAEIAKRGGISPATLYRMFDSKDDLVSAVLVHQLQVFVGELEEIDRDLPPEVQLIELASHAFRRLQEIPLLKRLFHTEPELILPELTLNAAPVLRFGTAWMEARLRRLMQDGRIPEADPEPLAEVLTRVIHSLVLTPEPTLQLGDNERRTEAIRLVFRRLLGLNRASDVD